MFTELIKLWRCVVIIIILLLMSACTLTLPPSAGDGCRVWGYRLLSPKETGIWKISDLMCVYIIYCTLTAKLIYTFNDCFIFPFCSSSPFSRQWKRLISTLWVRSSSSTSRLRAWVARARVGESGGSTPLVLYGRKTSRGDCRCGRGPILNSTGGRG